MDDNFLDSEESSFPLFSVAALKSSGQKGFIAPLIPPTTGTNLLHRSFPTSVNFPEEIEPVKKRRGRKATLVSNKNVEDSEVTLKEIIENQKFGVPTQEETKMKKDRLEKMQEKRAENRRQRKSALENKDASLPEQSKQPEQQPNAKSIETKPSILGLDDSFAFDAPRVIMQDGKIVLDNSNPVTNFKSKNKELTLADKNALKTTSMSFKPRNHTEKWTPEETKKFLKAIEIFGADFSMIAKLFPSRNRTQIKNKFRKEEKESADLVDQAFKKHKVFSQRSIMDRIENFSKNLQDDSGMPPILTTKDDFLRNQSTSSLDSMDMNIMSQLQDLFANEIHQAKKLNIFDTKATKDLKDINPMGASDLKAETTDISAFQNLPELKVEATPSVEQTQPEAEKNKNLIMGFLKK